MDFKSTMSVNLMQRGLNTRIFTPQVCSDGYNVSNLISNTSTGFLVEHFMKPPIFIDIEFMCNMYIHEIIINTRVGTQKSKGIEILVNDSVVGRCYIDSSQDVVHWVRNSKTLTNVNKNTCVNEFYTGAHRHLNSVRSLKLKIFKTENSSLVCVRSLKIFGSINKRTNDAHVTKLFVSILKSLYFKSIPSVNEEQSEINSDQSMETQTLPESLEDIPEDFLDPITHEFMTNPIILPSGKIIDKCTLDKYLENERCWCRDPNDPFTNVKFNTHQKPVQALQLKARIDKFLFLNKNSSVTEKLPRTFQNVYGKKSGENLLFKIMDSNHLRINESKPCDYDEKRLKLKTNSSYEVPNASDAKRRKLCSPSDILRKQNNPARNNATITSTDSWKLKTSSINKTGTTNSSITSYISLSDLSRFNNSPHSINATKPPDTKLSEIMNKFENSASTNVPHRPDTSHVTVDTSHLSGIDIIDLTHDPTPNNLRTDSDLDSQIFNSLKDLPSFTSPDTAQGTSTPDPSSKCFGCSDSKVLYNIVTCGHYICRQCLVSKMLLVCTHCGGEFGSGDVVRIFNS